MLSSLLCLESQYENTFTNMASPLFLLLNMYQILFHRFRRRANLLLYLSCGVFLFIQKIITQPFQANKCVSVASKYFIDTISVPFYFSVFPKLISLLEWLLRRDKTIKFMANECYRQASY